MPSKANTPEGTEPLPLSLDGLPANRADCPVARWKNGAYHAQGQPELINPILDVQDRRVVPGVFPNRFDIPTLEVLRRKEHERNRAFGAWKRAPVGRSGGVSNQTPHPPEPFTEPE